MSDPDSSLLTSSVILLVLIFFHALFTIAETAMISLNDNKLARLSEEGNTRAARILRLTQEPSKFLSTFQLGTTLTLLFAAAVASDAFSGSLLLLFPANTAPLWLARFVALLAVALLMTFVLLVFGELVPRRIGMLFPEAIALRLSGLFMVLFVLERPFVLALSFFTNGVLRLLGIDPYREPEHVTEEEIRMMVDVGNEKGSIEQSEKEMIDNIFELDDRTAGDVMTHRTELVAFDANDRFSKILPEVIEHGFSRVPVYEEDIDNIIGILYVKDLLTLIDLEDYDSVPLRSILREAMYVPETNNCDELLKLFQTTKVQMAVVVDEYGGTSGVVTMEDLLESIVGNIQDEYDNEEADFERLPDGALVLDAALPLDRAQKLLDIQFQNSDEFDTIGGAITDLLGGIPRPNEHPSVTVGTMQLTVLSSSDRRIQKIKATKATE